MPIYLTKINRKDTETYDAPRSVRRIRLKRNGAGVLALAAINGPGAYAAHLAKNGRGKKARRLRRYARRVRSPYYAKKLRSKADRLLMERAIDKSSAIAHLFGGDPIDAAANMYLAHNGRKKAKKWGRRARRAAMQMRYGRSRRSRSRARRQVSYARYKERKHWKKHAKKKWLKSIGAWDFVKAAKKGKKKEKWKDGEAASSTPSQGAYCSPGTGACYTKNGWRRKARKWGKKSRRSYSRGYSRGYGRRDSWKRKQWKSARRAMQALWWSNWSPSSSSSSSSSTSSTGRLRNTTSQAYCAGGSCDFGERPSPKNYRSAIYASGFSPRTGPLPKSDLVPNSRRRHGRRKKASYHGEHMAKHRKRRRGRARRRSRKYGFRRKGRRSGRRSARRRTRSRGRSRGRGRRSYRRNGEDMGLEMTPNRGRYGRRSWGKSRGRGRRYYGRAGFARHGFGLDPLAMFAKMGVENSSMGPEDKLKMLRRLSAPYMPRQSAYKRITVPVDVPYGIGKHKKMKVRFGAKVRTAFGPYKRRYGKRGMTYEYAKGKHIPDWALVGAPSEEFFKNNWPMFTKQMDAILSARGKRREQLAKKLAKLQERVSKMDVSPDAYTPNRRRGRKARRRGKKRFYRARDRFGRFTRKGRKGGRRRFRKWGKKRGSKRRGRGRKRFRRNGKSRRRSRRGKSRRRSRGRKGHRRHKRGKSRRRSRRGRGRRRSKRGKGRGKRGRGRRRYRRNGLYTMNGMIDAIIPTITMGAAAGVGLLAHKGVKNLILTHVLSSMDDSYKTPVASILSGMLLGGASTFVPHGMEAGVGVFASVFHDLATWLLMKAGATQAAAYLLGLGDIPVQSIRGFGRLGRLGEYELRGFRGLGEYELRGLGQAPMQAMAGAGYAQAAAGYDQAMAGYGEYELAGGVFDGIRPNNASIMRALNQADTPVQAAAGLGGGDYVEKFVEDGSEYVPTFLRPRPQMFAQDSLRDIGVPGTSILSAERAGVGEKDIWIPGQDQVVVNDPGPGGIFSDPASHLGARKILTAHFAWWVVGQENQNHHV